MPNRTRPRQDVYQVWKGDVYRENKIKTTKGQREERVARDAVLTVARAQGTQGPQGPCLPVASPLPPCYFFSLSYSPVGEKRLIPLPNQKHFPSYPSPHPHPFLSLRSPQWTMKERSSVPGFMGPSAGEDSDPTGPHPPDRGGGPLTNTGDRKTSGGVRERESEGERNREKKKRKEGREIWFSTSDVTFFPFSFS